MLWTALNRFLTLFLLAGTTLVLLFVVFSGSVSSYPFNHFYWLQADTSSIKGAAGVSRWTFWGICNPTTFGSSSNGHCNSLGPDYPISPLDNFGNSTSLPQAFVSNRDTYYYLSRFGFPMILLALVFAGVSFICSIFNWCWAAMKRVSFFFTSLALIFCATGVSCQTAVAVLAKNKFKKAGMNAKLGASLLGISWAALAALLIVFFLTCCSGLRSAYRVHKSNNQSTRYQGPEPISGPVLTGAAEDTNQHHSTLPSNEGGIRFFKIKRNQKVGDEESI